MGLLSRLREAVSASAEPQLQRGPDLSDETKAREALAEAAKNGTPEEQQRVRAAVKRKFPHLTEAAALRFLLREADVKRSGSAYEATIIREGSGNPGDRNYYTRQALKEAVAKGLFEGLQCYLNHPTATEERERPERDVQYLAGHFREARYVDGTPAEVRAKFIPGGMHAQGVTQLIESALESLPGRPLIGISIDGYGHAPDQQEINGRTYNMVREVTHLGSADIVTRAGAGGQFHRRLQEAWRNTIPAHGGQDTSKEDRMKPADLQEKIKAAAAKLTEAAGLKDEDTKAETLVNESLATLRECADATIEPDVQIREKIVEKPVPATDSKADELAVKLQEAEAAAKADRKARKLAETERDEIRAHNVAVKVMREASVPEKSARAWFDDVAACDGEDAMKQLVGRRMAERDEMLADLRESLGAVEGAGPRQPTPTASASGDLLDQLGLDRDEYGA